MLSMFAITIFAITVKQPGDKKDAIAHGQFVHGTPQQTALLEAKYKTIPIVKASDCVVNQYNETMEMDRKLNLFFGCIASQATVFPSSTISPPPPGSSQSPPPLNLGDNCTGKDCGGLKGPGTANQCEGKDCNGLKGPDPANQQ
eukprot:NODE_390_length_8164_cov_0.195908.p5 type:complete len:144 gc:universal NODE_390_length_8164_cov_0.195908:606-175(-)